MGMKTLQEEFSIGSAVRGVGNRGRVARVSSAIGSFPK